MIGIIYGIIFAALVGRVIEWNRFVKGVVYGLAIGAIALAAMPVMSAMTGGGGGAAKNPCGGKSGSSYGKQATNPCYPQAASGAVTKIASFTRPQVAIHQKATAYVCTNFNCRLPTNDPSSMLKLLNAPQR